jgi:four helix bundle protein
MQDFRNLDVWHKSHRLALDAYAGSAHFVGLREFDLRRQLVRAAISVPSNIAEGCGRAGDRDLRRFCRMALGSASELEYHLLLARDLGFLPRPAYTGLATQVVEVKRMLGGFIKRLTEELTAES